MHTAHRTHVKCMYRSQCASGSTWRTSIDSWTLPNSPAAQMHRQRMLDAAWASVVCNRALHSGHRLHHRHVWRAGLCRPSSATSDTQTEPVLHDQTTLLRFYVPIPKHSIYGLDVRIPIWSRGSKIKTSPWMSLSCWADRPDSNRQAP